MPPEDGSGSDAADQEAPFHTAPADGPTATQKLSEVHDTAEYPSPGVACGCQEVPFHTAAAIPELAEPLPTASQKVADTHDTAASNGKDTGRGWIFQIEPFHISGSAAGRPAMDPTASQNVAVTHDTPPRVLFVAPRGTAAC